MDEKTLAKYRARAEIIKALAHPTRLFIVDQLSHEEKCVCELTEKIGADMSTVSRHLSVLKKAGVVQMDKRGLKVFYQLRVPCVMKFFECTESVIRNTAKERLDMVE